jgi:hypothetical protein
MRFDKPYGNFNFVYQVINTLYSLQEAPAFPVLVQYLIVLFTGRPLVTVLARAPQLRVYRASLYLRKSLSPSTPAILLLAIRIGFFQSHCSRQEVLTGRYKSRN